MVEWTKEKQRVLIFLALLFVCGLSAAFAGNYVRLAPGAEQDIDAFSVKKRIRNNCPKEIFIPTNSTVEWNAFLAHSGCANITDIPSGPSMCGSSSHTLADCAAIGGTPYLIPENCYVCRTKIYQGNMQLGKIGVGNWPPAGWGMYKRWSSTLVTTACGGEAIWCDARNHNYSGPGTGGCAAVSCPGCDTCCTTGSHSFSDTPEELCMMSYAYAAWCSPPSSCGSMWAGAVYDEGGFI